MSLMPILLVLVLSFAEGTEQDSVVEYKDENLYGPVKPSFFTLTDDGQVFVATPDNEIIKFDVAGHKEAVFGGQGQGPGEFVGLVETITVQNNQLIVVEVGTGVTLHFFDKNGAFIQKTLFSKSLVYPKLTKVKVGWIVEDSKSIGAVKTPGRIYWTNDSFQERKDLLAISRERVGWPAPSAV